MSDTSIRPTWLSIVGRILESDDRPQGRHPRRKMAEMSDTSIRPTRRPKQPESQTTAWAPNTSATRRLPFQAACGPSRQTHPPESFPCCNPTPCCTPPAPPVPLKTSTSPPKARRAASPSSTIPTRCRAAPLPTKSRKPPPKRSPSSAFTATCPIRAAPATAKASTTTAPARATTWPRWPPGRNSATPKRRCWRWPAFAA